MSYPYILVQINKHKHTRSNNKHKHTCQITYIDFLILVKSSVIMPIVALVHKILNLNFPQISIFYHKYFCHHFILDKVISSKPSIFINSSDNSLRLS